MKFSIYKIYKNLNDACILKNVTKTRAASKLDLLHNAALNAGEVIVEYVPGDIFKTDQYTMWVEEA
tara:strand:- start:4410 stop:4607 length:198 start_codon:yes stop_codon:yes gene_type:complete